MGFLARLIPRDRPLAPFGPAVPSASQCRRALILAPAVLRILQSGRDRAEQTNGLINAAVSMPCFAGGPHLGGDARVEMAMMISGALHSTAIATPKAVLAAMKSGLTVDDRASAIHLALKGALLSGGGDLWDIGFLSSLGSLLGLSEDDFDTIFADVQRELP